MHNAPVAGDDFTLDGLPIVPAEDLVAAIASEVLPRYEEGDRR
ncbi:hypothetical protein ACFY83_34355 [Streptomyces althioticus]